MDHILIYTERLKIRKLMISDWRSMREIAEDFKKTTYYIYDRPLDTHEDEIKSITKRFAESDMFFAVLYQKKMIGYIGFHQNRDAYDLGFCFLSKYQGKGYAYESCSALIKYLSESKGTQRFTAGTALKNTPARRLLEKLGFTIKGTEKLIFQKDKNGKDQFFTGGIFEKQI